MAALVKQCQALWNFRHSLGAMMGNMWCYSVQEILPLNTLTTKYTFSILLFAVVDAHYNFVYVVAGYQGRISESGVFTSTELYKKLETKTLYLPQPMYLNGKEKSFPYILLEIKLFH
jgi:hypothetical protein